MKFVLNPETLNLKKEMKPLRCCILEPISDEKRTLSRWENKREAKLRSWLTENKLTQKPSLRVRVVGAPNKCASNPPFKELGQKSIKDKPLKGEELLGFEFEILREHLVESMHPNEFAEAKKMVWAVGYEFLGVSK